MSEANHRNLEEVLEIAKNEGLVAFLPRENELFVDLDCGQCAVNEKVQDILRSEQLVSDVFLTRSRSGNTHVYVRLTHPVSEVERIALQAALGSDPTREALSMAYHFKALEPTTVFFETPEQAERVEQWRLNVSFQVASLEEEEIPF